MQVRKALAHMIWMDEFLFNVVEYVGFNYFYSILQPLYKRIGRKQAKSDCDQVVQA